MSSLLRKKYFGLYYHNSYSSILTVVMVNERFRFRRFEGVINETNYARANIHKAHLYITRLETLGESVIAQDESDYNKYHHQRLKTDSILLETKEIHLFRIMKAIQSWESSDGILANELPIIATQAVRMKTITQKKKGFAGLFGKKETVQVPYITNEIQDFNKRLISARDWRNNQMEIYVNSLRLQNRLLNQNYMICIFLDNQTQQSFTERNLKVTEARQESFQLFILMVGIAFFIILISLYDLIYERKKR